MMPIKKFTESELHSMTMDQIKTIYSIDKQTFNLLDVRIKELQTLQKEYKSNIGLIDEFTEDWRNAELEAFFNENFVKDLSAGPLLAKELRGIFRDWKRSLGRSTFVVESDIFVWMKNKCGCGSTDKEFWGVREVGS